MTNGSAQVVIVAYRPKPGKEADLLQLTREHLVVLRGQGLATDMPETVLLAEGGVVVEVFEWAPGGAERAHQNPVVLALWKRYFDACDMVRLCDLGEATQMFASFRRLEL
jgi:hypothetical protein